jgi:carboxylate-amine ligase
MTGAALDPREVGVEQLEVVFDSTDPLTVGLEEEVMLLDPETLDLRPCAGQALERLGDEKRFKPELPASQLEILTPPSATPERALAALAEGRRDLAGSLDGLALPAVAGVHPFAAAEGELSAGERYERIQAEFGPVARRQLVASLQVHVAVGGASRTLAVYNALRSHLPDIAALAANAAIYEGRDSGMASVRPKIAELLPRQGLPPPIDSWEAFVSELHWGAAAGAVGEPRLWWWELRPHPVFGTLEVRVPDAQTTLAEAAAVVAFVHTLVAWLAERHDAGERLSTDPTWRIAENRWSASRYGVDGDMADLRSGKLAPTRDRLERLIDELGPIAEALGTASKLSGARELVHENGAIRQRRVAEADGARGLAAWMAERFLG